MKPEHIHKEKNIKVRIILKAKVRLGTTMPGDRLILYNDVFNERNGVAFYQIDKSEWDFISFEECTGMRDKNGKYIYEGDLLRDGSVNYPYTYEAYWDDKYQFSKRMFKTAAFMGTLSDNEHIVPDEMKMEIIGNIHENPELMPVRRRFDNI